ncbi:hypothetical protein [uncultured Tateyamaria sp.]|uniref:hypothetical protein n=1 Tax=uncultured Tateyamaria sp. TaxID=455651 RepID=UPI00261930D4|nr:hypothetical protein [uncultured Tateyamaria sp.]
MIEARYVELGGRTQDLKTELEGYETLEGIVRASQREVALQQNALAQIAQFGKG